MYLLCQNFPFHVWNNFLIWPWWCVAVVVFGKSSSSCCCIMMFTMHAFYTKKARAKTRTRKKGNCFDLLSDSAVWFHLMHFYGSIFIFSLSLPFVVFLGNCVMCWTSSLALLFLFVFPFISESKASSTTEMFMSVQNNNVKWPNYCLLNMCFTFSLNILKNFQLVCYPFLSLSTDHKIYFFLLSAVTKESTMQKKNHDEYELLSVVAISLIAWLNTFHTQKQAPKTH